MDDSRLKQAEASVRRTREEFDELAERAGEIDTQLEELPEPPRLGRALLMMLLLAVGVFVALIGVLAFLG